MADVVRRRDVSRAQVYQWRWALRDDVLTEAPGGKVTETDVGRRGLSTAVGRPLAWASGSSPLADAGRVEVGFVAVAVAVHHVADQVVDGVRVSRRQIVVQGIELRHRRPIEAAGKPVKVGIAVARRLVTVLDAMLAACSDYRPAISNPG